jgi:hypothetical protein
MVSAGMAAGMIPGITDTTDGATPTIAGAMDGTVPHGRCLWPSEAVITMV